MSTVQYLPSQRCCAVILALVLASPVRAEEQPPKTASESSVVVLRSGGVLQGTVSVSGERYVVTRPNSVVDVPAPQVLLVASSLEDAYVRQRQQLPRDTPEAHLALAEWCVRYNLVEPAKQELADARRLDPSDPRTALLERRLAVLAGPKQSPATSSTAISQGDEASKAELQKLDEIAADLPPGAMERFTRKVQPLLVNNCTAAGCHQMGGKQDFQLDRAVLHGLSNRRLALRNLVAVMELVDRDQPQSSELLLMARRAHGGQAKPMVGTRHEAQVKQLVDWVALLSARDVPPQPAEFVPEVVASPIKAMDPFGGAADVAPSQFLNQDVEQTSFDAVEQMPPKPAASKRKVIFGADLRPWQPKDEFDPEAFNRLKDQAVVTPPTAAPTPTVAPPAVE